MSNKLAQMESGIHEMFRQGAIDSASSGALLRLLKEFGEDEYHHRCASCYQWTNATRLGTVAIFDAGDGTDAVFVTCSDCAKRMGTDWERVSKRIESYLKD